MWDFLNRLAGPSSYSPQRHGAGWSPELVWLHTASDLLIWLAFLAIPLVLVYFIRRRPHTPFRWMLWMFGAFIVCAGLTHFMEVITSFIPLFWLSGMVKLVTVLVSWATVLALLLWVPKALALRSRDDLESEMVERKRAETRFRELLESAPDAMLIIKKDGEIVLVNSQTEKLFGYTRDELLGRPAEMLVPARFHSRTPSRRSGYFTQSRVRQREASEELYGLRKDGTEFPVEVRLTPLETAEGSLISSSIRDVTERKLAEELRAQQMAELAKSEEALRQQTRILKSILDSIGDGVLVADENGTFLLFNPAAERILAMDPSPAVTDTWTRRGGLYLPDMVTLYPTSDLPLVRAMRGDSVDGAEMYVRHPRMPEGIWTSVNARPLKDDQGALRGGVVVFRDVTARKRAEEQMQAASARLQQSNRELQDFASVASHDLQEPLRKVQAFGDRLQATCREALTEQGRDYLDRMLTAAGRMRSLIDDLLTFSRVTTKAQPFLPVDLRQVAQEVLGDLEERVRQTGGRVEVGALPTIDADPLQMRQLLQNLIGNALKFHRAQEAPVIQVTAQMVHPPGPRRNGNGAAAHCQVRVQDNGIGFDEKYLDRLFQVFQRLHGRSEYEGTGMGLAICRRIAERHSGSITARATPGQGATFIVTLPARQPRGALVS